MTAHVPFPLKTRLFCLLAGLSALALAACTATPTPAALDTATPPAAAPSATTAPTATKPTVTATEAAAATATATATASEASDTPTKAVTATPTETEAATATATKTGAAGGTPAATESGGGGQTIFNTVSIWDIASTVDTSNCTNPFNPPYGLVQITPTDNGLQWHNTVPEDYTFTKVADRTYAYSGPNGIGTGTVSLQVTFTSDTTLTLSQTYQSNDQPDCAHVFSQPGTFQYFR